MSEIVPAGMLGRIRDYFDEQGLTEAVGGSEALDEGLRQLAAGALPLVGELAAADTASVGLAEAVGDADRFPHLVRVHGFLDDVLVMNLPRDLMPWARRIASAGHPPGTRALRKAAAAAAVTRADALAHLARFALFEALCLNQRLVLRAEGGHLEAINGRGCDIEAIAEREVELAVAWRDYGQDLARMDDPLRALIAVATVSLQDHVEQLRHELRSLRAEVHETLENRRQILEVMDALPADQAVLVYNECAAMFGEEKLEAEQLQAKHPAMLGNISRDAIYQRVHRLPARVEKIRLEPVDPSERLRKPSSLADLILAASAKGDPS